MTEQDRIALFENQVAEIFDALEQIAKDLELTEANIRRTLEGLRPEAKAEKERPIDNIAVNEITFSTLKFEPQKGAKLGDYEIAYKAANLPDKWQSAYNILTKNNSTIKSRYYGKEYVCSYWLYGSDKIYRQKLKGDSQPT